MERRADFKAPVVKALAERAGFICSFPGCEASTIGPSEESATSSAKTGMACHIYAAADGPSARRANPQKSIEELRSIENGIWMCYRHGKLIDSDECSYTPSILYDWRRLAEKRANLRHMLGREVTADDLAREALASASVPLNSSAFIEDVFETIRLSCVESIWGERDALAARDFIIEIARNSLTHGKAKRVELEVTPHTITLSDDGDAFSLSDLEASARPRGGVMSLTQLRKRAANLVVSYVRAEDHNKFTIASCKALGELLTTNPCSTTVYGGPKSVFAAMEFIQAHPECGTIFLRPKYGILSYSDLHNLAAGIKHYKIKGRDIALVMKAHSDGIKEFLAKEVPSVRLIEAEED